ncbi:hypothetical protein Y032_0654g1187 [Ancylostoma ceylanicum]|nr:hypothetical protein Y032_0654g1187 [Ancylostoma ceylanicum]
MPLGYLLAGFCRHRGNRDSLAKQMTIRSFTFLRIHMEEFSSPLELVPTYRSEKWLCHKWRRPDEVRVERCLSFQDLVKTHLMFAVREEVDILRTKIADLESHVSRLIFSAAKLGLQGEAKVFERKQSLIKTIRRGLEKTDD